MRSLPIHIRNGVILAKAVCIASISHPYNFGVEEVVNAYNANEFRKLKAGLFGEDGRELDYNKSKTSCDVAIMIYERYRSFCPNSLDCTCYIEMGLGYECDRCKEHRLTMAMVDKILKWLKEHKDELQDIDYADDVDLVQD